MPRCAAGRACPAGVGGAAPADRAGAAAPVRRDASTRHVEELALLEVRNAGHPIGARPLGGGARRDVLHYYAGAPERTDRAGRSPSPAAST